MAVKSYGPDTDHFRFVRYDFGPRSWHCWVMNTRQTDSVILSKRLGQFSRNHFWLFIFIVDDISVIYVTV